jgi:LPXTG-motif cell wall-anchored protein
MIDETVTVDANGNWDFQVPQNLAPGTYKITLKGTDLNGNPLEKPYTFTVNASASVASPLPTTGIISSNLLLWIAIVLLLMVAIFVHILRTKSFEERITTHN